MTNKKPIIDKGIIIYNDYEFIFNFLKDEELGKLIRVLLKTHLNPTLNPTDNDNINNSYNYIANRILDYQNKRGLYSEWGKKGGNPTLNPTDKLKEKKRKEEKTKEEEEETIKEIKEKYGEFKNVLLSDIEYQKLIIKFKNENNLKKYIDNLSIAIKSKDYKYKDFYAVMIGWVFKKFEEENNNVNNKMIKTSNNYNHPEEFNRDEFLKEIQKTY